MSLELMQQNSTYERWAWPGGYPLYYLVADYGVLCAGCANEHYPRTLDPEDTQFHVIAVEVNWENPDLCCDHCSAKIEAAYDTD